MKTGWFNKRIIYNDLLAIALAGIVSLLFTQGVCQFLNTASKKQYQCCKTSLMEDRGDFDQDYSHNGNGPVSQADSYYLIPETFNFTQFRLVKNIFVRGVNLKLDNKMATPLYNSCSLPPFWNPSIPIAHRKLII